MFARNLLIAILISLLAACGSMAIDDSPRNTKVPLNISQPQPLNLKKVKWILITPENADRVFSELKAQGVDPVLFGVMDKGYIDLSENMEKVQGFIVLQKQIIEKYKEYYESNQ